MDFSDALRIRKAGRRVRRVNWRLEGWSYIRNGVLYFGDEGTPYTVSSMDLLSNDWEAEPSFLETRWDPNPAENSIIFPDS